MDHQRRAVRAELHGIVDRAVDDWEWIDSLSGSVRAVSGGGGSSSSDVSDPTLAAVLAGDEAGRWLDRFRAMRVEARLLDAARAKMAPVDPKKVRRGRENTVEQCVRCQGPAPKVHRIDGHPYCATSCYYAEHRERGTWSKPKQAS